MKHSMNRQVALEAAAWATKIEAGDLTAEEREALADWMARSPEHVDELMLNSALLHAAADLKGGPTTVSEADLHAEAQWAEVIKMPVPAAAAPVSEARRRGLLGLRLAAFGALAGVALLLTVGTLRGLSDKPEPESVAATTVEAGPDQPRQVLLADGSEVRLNTNSQVAVALAPKERLATVVGGEVFFDVASDAKRPFSVRLGKVQLKVVGTRFNVRVEPSSNRVSVQEGQVELRTPRGRTLALRAGDSARWRAGDEAALVSKRVDPSHVSAWLDGRVAFTDASIPEVLAEFRRYVDLEVVLDLEAPLVRYSGIFEADDFPSFVSFLESSARYGVEKRDGVLFISSRRQ